MIRILALLLLAVLVVLAARRLLLRARRSPLGQLAETLWRSQASPPAPPDRGGERQAGAALYACDRCGVHVPVERLRATRGGRLCERCRRAGAGPDARGEAGAGS
ncbi:MAG TPA: hypothetical protein VMV46_11190 [Thermoanaerobaculia bacterium]|nr:hypothetical protein [Thermoanaerobaculia bacterium]